MGWCSATEFIDWAIGASDAVATELRKAEDAHQCCPFTTRDEVDELIRPFVAKIAGKLRREDWDCQSDSAYFDRFPREMLGLDAAQFAEWLREQGGDPKDFHIYPEETN